MLSEKEQKETYKERNLQGIKCYIHYSAMRINFCFPVLPNKIKKMIKNQIKDGFEDHNIFAEWFNNYLWHLFHYQEA